MLFHHEIWLLFVVSFQLCLHDFGNMDFKQRLHILNVVLTSDLNNILADVHSKRSFIKSTVVSFIYTENNSGPRTEPCGTPLLTVIHLEKLFKELNVVLYYF
jgi:hypothetical protein